MKPEHAVTFFKGILQGPKENYLHAIGKKLDETFFEGPQRVLWILNSLVYKEYGSLLDFNSLQKLLPQSNIDEGMKLQTEEFWFSIERSPEVTETEFKVTVGIAIKDQKTKKVGEALASGLEYLKNGVEDRKTGKILLGADEASLAVRVGLAEADKIGADDSYEVTLSGNAAEILEDALEAHVADKVSFGMVPIDEMTVGGIAPGEWAIIMAGTGVGKSQFCVNVVHAALMDGQNVFYATTETMAKQILNRLAIRHSRDPKFGVRNGLSSKKLKQHTTENPVLSEEEVLAFHAVITDLTGNPEYGELLITQVSEGTKVSTIEAQAHIFHEQHELGLLVIDSPEMLGADTRRSEERSELNEIANKMKSLALSFNNKKGIPLLTPWQASRAGQERAENSGRYDKRALSDTAMAEKRADLIIGLLENLDNPSKIKGQTLKYRELEGDDFELDIDLDNCYIGSSESLMDVETSYAGLL